MARWCSDSEFSFSERHGAVPTGEGARIYDVQNKDTVAWYPTGEWIIAAIELPQHAGSHSIAKSGLGCFVDIWAVYVRPGDSKFGKIWVQLTDWTRGWKESELYDNIALVPYNASEKLCPAGTQYASTPKDIPFAYYHGSAAWRTTADIGRDATHDIAIASTQRKCVHRLGREGRPDWGPG